MRFLNFNFKPYNSSAKLCECTYCNKKKKKDKFAPSSWHNPTFKYRRCRECASKLNKIRRDRLKEEDPDAYYKAEKEKRLNYIKKNPERYKERKREQKKRAYKKNPDKFRIKRIGSGILRRARGRGIKYDMEPYQLRDWVLNQEQKCHYCNSSLNKIKKFYKNTGKTLLDKRLTVDRKENKKGYTFENLVLSCRICNDHKSEFFSYEDFKIIAKKYIIKEIKKKTQKIEK